MASLNDLAKDSNFVFTADQIVHIFTRSLELVLLLHSKGYYHSDIKPGNVTLVNVEGQEHGGFEAKVIDFGELSNEATKVIGCTSEYYKHPNRQYD